MTMEMLSISLTRKGRVDATHSEYNPVTHTYNDEVNETLCEGD